MRPYIIINGTNSQSIEGLVISTTPSISKPAIRTSVEEIDGRDGDIVTKLGYSAYDKEIDIGLSFDYDVDEVIKFFNSEGVVTFSNEPDKYYRFEILEQIDFERLIRFKTATVTFHCQPFKFSVAEHSRVFEINDQLGEIDIRNNGNIYSKPIITITARNNVSLHLDNNQNITIAMGEEYSTIVIDVEKLNAYFYETGNFANRVIVGDYTDLELQIGKNTLSYQGEIKEIKIENYSRWI
jgi:putative phage tail component, N-terminal domain protein|nr:MAG TPA: distal tail protein [Caudoviricetes sp.]